MTKDIKDKVVFITGGARGIGAETARQLVAKGAKVALVDLDAAEVQRTAAALGPQAATFQADVTDVASLDAAVTAAIEHFGGIDIVLANAGISGQPNTFRATAQSDFERVIEVNLLGVTRTVRATLEHVINRQGYILVVASLAALVPSPLVTSYVASKHAVEGFGRALRTEIAYTGTDVGVAYFGFIDTDMTRVAFADPLAHAANRALPGLLRNPTPVGRAARAIVFGIERRRMRVTAPWWIMPTLRLRGVITGIDKLMGRQKPAVEALKAADAARKLSEESSS